MRIKLFCLCVGWSLLASGAELPVEIFFKDAEFSSPSLSPDGKFIAAIMPYKERWNLTVIDMATRKSVRITGSDDHDVLDYTWLNNDRLIFKISIDDVFEGGGLYAINRDGSKFQTIVPSLRRQIVEQHVDRPLAAEYFGEVPGSASDILISAYPRNADEGYYTERPRIYRVDTYTGRRKLVLDNPGNIRGWIADWSGQVRVGWEAEKTSKLIYRASDNNPWESLPQTWDQMEPLHFSSDNKTVYVASHTGGRDKAAIAEYDPGAKKIRRVLFEHDDVDIDGGLIFSHKDHRLIGVRYVDERTEINWVDPALQKIQARLDGTLTNTINHIISYSDDLAVIIVKAWSDRQPGIYYLFDTVNPKLESIASVASWIKPDEMSPMKAIEFKSRDGLTLHGYLTIPRAANGKNLPLVLLVHGGPFGNRDEWEFQPEVQFLANRGYAVLQVNFRGSGGYGRAFEEAGYKQWGRKMQDDLSDGVKWAVAQGVADPKRVCIMGGSYGGYAAMAGLAFTPELYRCGVNLFGPSDLLRLLNERQKQPDALNFWAKRLGDPKTDKDELLARSPAYHAEDIKAPVFMCYGQLDTRVDIEHGYLLQKALKRAGNPPIFLTPHKEGHGIFVEKDRLQIYPELEKFLKKNLL